MLHVDMTFLHLCNSRFSMDVHTQNCGARHSIVKNCFANVFDRFYLFSFCPPLCSIRFPVSTISWAPDYLWLCTLTICSALPVQLPWKRNSRRRLCSAALSTNVIFYLIIQTVKSAKRTKNTLS